jgi:hypothetical protein
LIRRNPERIDVLLGDMCYDDQKVSNSPGNTRVGH